MNKNLIIGIIVGVILTITIITGFFFIQKNFNTKQKPVFNPVPNEQVVIPEKPEKPEISKPPVETIETSNEFLQVIWPKPNQKVLSPVTVSGKSNFFEASTNIRIKDDNGEVLAETYATANGWMDDLYPFTKDVAYLSPTTTTGVVEVFEESAKDGSEINKISIPVIFEDLIGETEEMNLSKCNKNIDMSSYKNTIKYSMFGDDEFETAVCGYLVTEDVEVFGEQITSAKFRIIQFADPSFKASIEQGISEENTVNAPAGSVLDFGLGCFENGKIWGDSDYPEGQYITIETNNAIVNSTLANPVALKLTFGLHGGRGCTCCNLAHLVRMIN